MMKKVFIAAAMVLTIASTAHAEPYAHLRVAIDEINAASGAVDVTSIDVMKKDGNNCSTMVGTLGMVSMTLSNYMEQPLTYDTFSTASELQMVTGQFAQSCHTILPADQYKGALKHLKTALANIEQGRIEATKK